MPPDTRKQVVFDIETIPLSPGEYDESLDEIVERKLERAIKNNAKVDTVSERSKIMATEALLGRIVCIALYYPTSDTKVAIYDDSEKVILEKFWKAIADFNGTFVGFNSVRFDTPFILKRSMVHRIKPTNNIFLQYTKFDPFPAHFDVMLQLGGRDGFIGLKHACAAFGIASPKDGAIHASNVAQAYRDGKIKQIAEYCLRDVIATHKLSEVIIDYISQK